MRGVWKVGLTGHNFKMCFASLDLKGRLKL
jgi:hypothetical protein